MNLILETTTGRLTPAGVAPSLRRGSQSVFLQFVTNGVAALLPDGQPITLNLFELDDPLNPIVQLGAWTALATDVLYKATLDTLTVAELAWLQQAVLTGRIDYGNPLVNSQTFQVNYGGGTVAAAEPLQIKITQPTGPVNYVQEIGTFAGRLAVGQTEGFWRVKAPCNLLGVQLNAQDAPVGANVIADIVKNGVALNKLSTLTDGQKSEETIFGAPVALVIGDIVQFQPTQVGVAKKGSNLTAKAILQLL